MIFAAIEGYFKKLKTPVWDKLGIAQTTWIQYKTKKKLPQRHIDTLSLFFGEGDIFKTFTEEEFLRFLVRKYYT